MRLLLYSYLDFLSVPGKYTARYLARVSGQGRVMNWDHQRDTTCASAKLEENDNVFNDKQLWQNNAMQFI